MKQQLYKAALFRLAVLPLPDLKIRLQRLTQPRLRQQLPLLQLQKNLLKARQLLKPLQQQCQLPLQLKNLQPLLQPLIHLDEVEANSMAGAFSVEFC